MQQILYCRLILEPTQDEEIFLGIILHRSLHFPPPPPVRVHMLKPLFTSPFPLSPPPLFFAAHHSPCAFFFPPSQASLPLPLLAIVIFLLHCPCCSPALSTLPFLFSTPPHSVAQPLPCVCVCVCWLKEANIPKRIISRVFLPLSATEQKAEHWLAPVLGSHAPSQASTWHGALGLHQGGWGKDMVAKRQHITFSPSSPMEPQCQLHWGGQKDSVLCFGSRQYTSAWGMAVAWHHTFPGWAKEHFSNWFTSHEPVQTGWIPPLTIVYITVLYYTINDSLWEPF